MIVGLLKCGTHQETPGILLCHQLALRHVTVSITYSVNESGDFIHISGTVNTVLGATVVVQLVLLLVTAISRVIT